MSQDTTDLKRTALVLGLIGCITMTAYIIRFLVQTQGSYSVDYEFLLHISLLVLLVSLSFLGAIMLNHSKPECAVIGGQLLWAIAIIAQPIFGFTHEGLLSVAFLWVAGCLGLRIGWVSRKTTKEKTDAAM
ncbi:hypothetical protein N5D52_21075 [Pseudomonas sp. GD03860]|uniref:hypothetical protein n=1 Tax=Pseudomonas TaxID=286 RepID=UPI002364A17E|nr:MULTISPECIES: hypothetical protein [Pseudomonas]MDD2058996.1 hypothetical protein [Pseudomonas putida]MDH0639427.1 hypothetical protein [Pseudomonas sp. GD03860]